MGDWERQSIQLRLTGARLENTGPPFSEAVVAEAVGSAGKGHCMAVDLFQQLSTKFFQICLCSFNWGVVVNR